MVSLKLPWDTWQDLVSEIGRRRGRKEGERGEQEDQDKKEEGDIVLLIFKGSVRRDSKCINLVQSY